MRLFIQENPELGIKAHVFLDGVDISADCFGADEELGEAHRYSRDNDGNLQRQHISAGEYGEKECTPESRQFGCSCGLVTEIRHGEVRIELPKAAEGAT